MTEDGTDSTVLNGSVLQHWPRVAKMMATMEVNIDLV